MLVVLNAGHDEKFMKIKILENRYEEIKNLKLRFIRTIIDIVKGKLEEISKPVMEKFQNYIINYIPEVEIFH